MNFVRCHPTYWVYNAVGDPTAIPLLYNADRIYRIGFVSVYDGEHFEEKVDFLRRERMRCFVALKLGKVNTRAAWRVKMAVIKRLDKRSDICRRLSEGVYFVSDPVLFADELDRIGKRLEKVALDWWSPK